MGCCHRARNLGRGCTNLLSLGLENVHNNVSCHMYSALLYGTPLIGSKMEVDHIWQWVRLTEVWARVHNSFLVDSAAGLTDFHMAK